MCIAQGTNNGAEAALIRPATREGWSPGPRHVCQMLQASSGRHGPSILLQWRGNCPLFGQLLTLYVHPRRHKRRGGGCFKPTLYVRRVVSRAPARASDTLCLRRNIRGVNPTTKAGGVIGLCLGNLVPLCATPRSAPVISYDPRQVHFAAQRRSEDCNS